MTEQQTNAVIHAAIKKLGYQQPNVLSRYCSATELAQALVQMRIDQKTLLDEDDIRKAGLSLEKLSREGFSFIPFPQWKTIPLSSRIFGLYTMGNPDMEAFFTREPLLVTGSVDMTDRGKQLTEDIVGSLDPQKHCLVTSLSHGVGMTAAQTAMETGLPTLAVLPTIDAGGPDKEKTLAIRLSQTEGCAVVSPFPPETEPDSATLMVRNVTMAKLCSTCVVVESKIKGNAMMTAKIANSFAKTVLAVPGDPDDLMRRGCNELIRSGQARLVSNTKKIAIFGQSLTA